MVCSCKRVSYAIPKATRNIPTQAQTIALNQCSTIFTRITLVMCVPYGMPRPMRRYSARTITRAACRWRKDTITRIWVTDSVPNDRNNSKKEIHSLEPKRYNDYFYFERGIYDEENGSWGSQAIHLEELTFFGIEGRFLVDADGNPVFIM